MGRGHKFCKSCGADNGPRSFSCKVCGIGFIVNGVKQPDQTIIPSINISPHPIDMKVVEQSLKDAQEGNGRTITDILTLGKGKKKCPSCSIILGVRQRVCPKCNYAFSIKGVQHIDLPTNCPTNLSTLSNRKELKDHFVEWQTLKKNDTIRVKSGGPIWPASSEEKQDIPMGYYGLFRVKSLDDNGIHAVAIGKNADSGGNCFIYCGPDKAMPSGSIMKAHNIVKVKIKQKVKTNEN